MKQATLCLIVKDQQILLAMKKRGFGVGRWNGTGGKVKEGEEVIDAAIRETKEEIGVVIKNPEKVGFFHFAFKYNPDWDLDVHVYLATEWAGEPAESEEMNPQWFSLADIPYDQMWSDDKYWLPMVLEGKKVKGEFLFGKHDQLLEHTINTLS